MMNARELVRRVRQSARILFGMWIEWTDEEGGEGEVHPDQLEKTCWHEAGHAAYLIAMFGPKVSNYLRVGQWGVEGGSVHYTLSPHYNTYDPFVHYGELVVGIAAGRVTYRKFGCPDYGARVDVYRVWDEARDLAACEAPVPLHSRCDIHAPKYEERAREIVEGAIRCVDTEMDHLIPFITRLADEAREKRYLDTSDLERIWIEVGQPRIDHKKYFTAPPGYVPHGTNATQEQP